MYGTNTKGRPILKGSKGGLYVMQNGKKVYKFKKASSSPTNNVPASYGTNTKGRPILKGPKGGLYVMQNGKKVYKFKKAAASPAPPKSGGHLTTPMKKRLVNISRAVKSRSLLVPNPSKFPKVPIQFEQFIYSGKEPSLNGGKKSLKLQRSIDVINGLNNSVMGPRLADLPSQNWINSQVEYIRNLNTYDFYTAMAYTVRSHEWIGRWMYHKIIDNVYFSKPSRMIAPLFPQMSVIAHKFNSDYAKEFVRIMNDEPTYLYTWYNNSLNYIPNDMLEEALNLYTKDLTRIIKQAPPLDKSITVYRGVMSDIFKGKPGAIHSLEGFASTSYVPRYEYADRMYMRIKVLKGSRVLLLQALNTWDASGEFEILLNMDSKYIIRKRDLLRPVMNRNIRADTYGRLLDKYVTDITLIT